MPTEIGDLDQLAILSQAYANLSTGELNSHTLQAQAKIAIMIIEIVTNLESQHNG